MVRSNQTRILQEASNSNQSLRTEIEALAKMSSSLFTIYMSIKKNIMKTTGSLAGYNLLSNGEIDQYLDTSFFNPYTIDRIDSEFTYHIELMIKLTKEAHNNYLQRPSEDPNGNTDTFERLVKEILRSFKNIKHFDFLASRDVTLKLLPILTDFILQLNEEC